MTDLAAITDAALAAERASWTAEIDEWVARYDRMHSQRDEALSDVERLSAEVIAYEQAEEKAAELVRIEAERVAALPGQVNFFRDASASFDIYTRSPDAEMQAWMRGHYHRMRVYSPYFDSRLEGETT